VVAFGFVWFSGCGCLECSGSGVSFVLCWSASWAETCSEIVSNKGTVNDVAPRRRKTAKSDLYSAIGC
jgi:hypothetical protein